MIHRRLLPSQGEWVFWDVHDPAKAIGIELRDEHYSKLIIEADNPAALADQVAALASQAAPSQVEAAEQVAAEASLLAERVGAISVRSAR